MNLDKNMLDENQNIEFKESWRDEYIKWICGFANAKGGKIYIGVDDSGDLPENWTIDTLLTKHSSKPYNPTIAYPFFLAGYIESWGRGIEKIIYESEKFNGITPEFRWDNGLWVEFDFSKTSNKLGDKLGNLSKNRQLLLKYIQDNSKITIPELSKLVDISTTAIENNIKYLKENNLLRRVGGAKDGYWEKIDERS